MFHQKQTAYSVEAIKSAHPVSHYPVEAIPASGIQLLGEAKRFLLERRLIPDDFALQQGRGDGCRFSRRQCRKTGGNR